MASTSVRTMVSASSSMLSSMTVTGMVTVEAPALAATVPVSVVKSVPEEAEPVTE